MANNFASGDIAWHDTEVYIQGRKIVKVRAVQYKISADPEVLYAAGNQPIGIQMGNAKYEGSLKLLKGAVDELNRAAKAAGYPNIIGVPLNIVINFKATPTTPMQTATLVYAFIYELDRSIEQNAKMMEVTLPFLSMDIVED